MLKKIIFTSLALLNAQAFALSDRYLEALQYMHHLHKEQTRKGNNIPYVSHLESVASIVWKNGGSENEAIAALLHDAAEDQGGIATLNEIRARFGSEVADIVAGCSDTFVKPKPAWQVRKQKYIDHLKDTSASVRLVSAGDKLDNIRDIHNDYLQVGDEVWTRFKASKKQTLWYYQSCADIFVEQGPKLLGQQIQALVEDIKSSSQTT